MIHIIGIVGVPGSYGGFETLADHLLESNLIINSGCTVYCERNVYNTQGEFYKGASLVPLRWKANGWQSVFYDLNAIYIASRKGEKLLILGTSATFALPLFRFLFPKVTYIVNMAGLEWSRSKWGPFARWYLKLNEKIAAKFSHFLVTDNMGLKDYVESEYKEDSFLIPYGGDQFLYASNKPEVFDEFSLPSVFDFAMARSQIDNNMEVILDAYAKSGLELVFVSNWNSTKYGQVIFQKYNKFSNLNLIGPIYDIGKIKALYSRTRLYVHGHSAGGTNPVLVESMWARLPILAFDVSFNRHTTQNKAFYFSDADELHELSASITNHALSDCAKSLFEIANNLYKWENVISLYESLIFDQPSE